MRHLLITVRVILVLFTMLFLFSAHVRPVNGEFRIQGPSDPISYYVSVTGDDTNPGTRSRPWRTIQHAADTMSAGNVANILDGTYTERVEIYSSGNDGAPITFQAMGSVTMRGFRVQADYITIRGFEIANSGSNWADGVGILVDGSQCLLEQNYIHDAAYGGIVLYANEGDDERRTGCAIRDNRLFRNGMFGLQIYGRNHQVERNEIWGTVQYHPDLTDRPNWADADGIHFFGSGHLIRGNYIHDIRLSDPENVNPHIDCFQTWEVRSGEAGHDIVFEQNFCENLNVHMYAFMLKGARNLLIRNNILQSFGHLNTGGGGNSDLTIVNNVLTSDLTFPVELHPVGISLEDSPNTTVKNNIFYDLPAQIIFVTGTSVQGLDVGYNLAYRSDGQTLWGDPYPTDLWGLDPQFVDPASGIYHLQASSPAIDAGQKSGIRVTDDYAGTSRPQGAGYDIGAFEYEQPRPNMDHELFLPIIM